MKPAQYASMSSIPPLDQAHGLRQMFGSAQRRIVPIVANESMETGGVLLERLCTAFAELGQRTLVVDASQRAAEAGEWACLDLAQCVESLGARVSYLGARGLPMRYLDPHGSTAPFLDALMAAEPLSDVLLVHAPASDLARMFMRAEHLPRATPVLLAEDRPSSVTEAYAAMKLLCHRAGWVVYDLLLSVSAQSPRAERISQQIGRCADDFLGAALRQSLFVDPICDPCDPAPHALRRWAAVVLQPGSSTAESYPSRPAAMPVSRGAMN
jgi:flagellar biosynthesis protein FlhG